MKRLIATFSYAGNFYELFVDKYGKTSVIVIGKNKYHADNDVICKKVISKINELRNEYSCSIDFYGEKIDVYYDEIIDLFYFKKDGIRIKEDNNKYLKLFKAYNYLPDFSNYDSYSYESDYSSNNGYSYNTDYSSGTGYSYGNDYSYNTEYGGLSNDQYYQSDYNYKSSLKKKKKKLKIAIGSAVLSISLLVGGFVTIPRIINAKEETNTEIEISDVEVINDEIDDTPVIVYEDDLNLTIEEQIRNSINNNCGEQPEWVYEEAIASYYEDKKYDRLWEAIDNGASQEEIDKINEEIASQSDKEEININLASERTNKMIEAINSNGNISQEDKQIIINGLFNTMQLDSKYYDEENFKRVIYYLSNFTIDKAYLENDTAKVFEDGLTASGEYHSIDNSISIYCKADYEHTLCHEVQHILGGSRDRVQGYSKINEGMTEIFCGNDSSYHMERCFYIMLEQIYGEDFFKDAFYNGNCMKWAFRERYGEEGFSEHYELYQTINSFLVYYQLENNMESLYNNVVYQNEINNLINRLMIKYDEVTGLNCHDNKVLLACESYLTGKNKTLPDNLKVDSVRRDLDGKCYLNISGTINYSYDVVNDGFVETKNVTNMIKHDEMIR